MCLIVVSHRVWEHFPLVIAANRDEEYDRPTRAAHFWNDAPDILGGRDERAGGSWLSITRGGRVAAVTNLRGVSKPGAPSRGLLVRDFVTSSFDPAAYARGIHKEDFAGFHLIVGEIGSTFVHLSDELREWPPGIHGVGNEPCGAPSAKIDWAVERTRAALPEGRTPPSAQAFASDLLQLLADRTVFVATPRYGTRSSTAIVATTSEIVFVEQSYRAGGVRDGEPNVFRLTR